MFLLYRIVLSLHLVSVISWMAEILYLIRLFVYHAAETETVVKERFIVMERKLYSIITAPAMIASLVFGATMLGLNPILLSEPWMHAKLLFVACLMIATQYANRMRLQFALGSVPKSEKFFRIFNEIPTLLMILIVFMVILRPF
jgi:protoporphyrinogen IX oxidase